MTKRKNYRNVYKKYYGEIPKDSDGRTWDVHHIDGDYTNNNPENLVAVSIQEHYDIHFRLGEWSACQAIAIRMNKSPLDITEIAKKVQGNRVSNGTHNFLGPESNQRRIDDGSHNFLGPSSNQKRIDDGTHHFLVSGFQQRAAAISIKNGTNKFVDPEWQKAKAKKAVEDGTHNFSQLLTCPYCGKTGGAGPMTRWHGDNCKNKSTN